MTGIGEAYIVELMTITTLSLFLFYTRSCVPPIKDTLCIVVLHWLDVEISIPHRAAACVSATRASK